MESRAPHIPYHPFWENPYWMGSEYYRLPLQGQWGYHPWARKLLRRRIIATWGHEGSRKSGWERPVTKSAHRWHAVWFGAWMEHHRCHIYYTLVTRNIPCHQQKMYMAFVDLEKTLHHVPRRVIWWALRKLGIEWLVWLKQTMYENARNRVRVGCTWVKGSVWKWVFTKTLARAPTVNHGFGSNHLTVWCWKSMRNLICRWLSHPHWITGGTASEADQVEV